MSYRFRRILVLAALTLLAFAGIYAGTRVAYADRIELTVFVKTYNNAGLRLYYNDQPGHYELDHSDLHNIFASQYIKPVIFSIPDADNVNCLRLDLGDVSNQVFIEKIQLGVKSVSRKEIAGSWQGTQTEELIASYNDAPLVAKNSKQIQLSAGATDPYLLFNESIARTLRQYYQAHPRSNTGPLAASIILSLLIAGILSYFLPRDLRRRARIFAANGGVLIAGATGIIGIVFLNNHFHFIQDKGNAENRMLAAEPEFTLHNFFTYPELYSDYSKDNFSFRNYLFYAHSRYMTDVFHESPMPEDAILGKKNWLFDNDAYVVADYRRIADISPMELAQLAKTMYEKKKWLNDRGIRFYVMVGPNKMAIYSELLPRGFFQTRDISENRLVAYRNQLARYAGIELVDPSQALLRAKKVRDVYYQCDTHWNLYGGYIGYRELMRQICRDFPMLRPAEEEAFNISTFPSTEGDLAGVLGLSKEIPRTEVSMTFKDTSLHLVMPTASQIVIDYDSNKTIDGSHLKLLMLRDSYANYLIPFLNLHFEKAKYIWSYDFPDKIIEQEKPDVVIFESLQRFMSTAFAVPNPESLDTAKHTQPN